MSAAEDLGPADPLAQLRAMEHALLTQLSGNPFESLCLLVGAGAAVFYWAEAGTNDKVNDYWDALHYVATSLSVGYANVFPVTPVGKIVGALVMMVGPALSSRALDAADAAADAASQQALLAKLDEVIAELRRLREPSP
ncbi:MAG TPA: potassium channel family protein [Polyangia bacterium]|nr:potassium channel family protein [Polyangia bacterium]